MFRGPLSFALHDACPVCGLRLKDDDSGDGPVVFIIFVLCFLLVPVALVVEFTVGLPLWAHIVLWGGLSAAVTLGTLKPLRAYTLALTYKYRPWDK